MQVLCSNEKIIGPGGELVRAKRNCDGNIVLYPDVIALDYRDISFGIKMYLSCFKAVPKTLYVHRPLLNALEVVTWAKANGFPTTLAPADMHVTIAFSRDVVDWSTLAPRTDSVQVAAGERSLEVLGIEKDAVVLRFASNELAARWQEFKDAGASWDWPGYKPHITISYNGKDVDLDKIAPYAGPLHFGPEVFAEVKEDWKDNVAES